MLAWRHFDINLLYAVKSSNIKHSKRLLNAFRVRDGRANSYEVLAQRQLITTLWWSITNLDASLGAAGFIDIMRNIVVEIFELAKLRF